LPLLAGIGAAPQRWANAGLGTHPVGVVPGGGQELAGDLHTDADQVEQGGRGGGDELLEVGVGRGDLGSQLQVAAGQPAEREPGGLVRVVQQAGHLQLGMS
jgi:hypothetical protein